MTQASSLLSGYWRSAALAASLALLPDCQSEPSASRTKVNIFNPDPLPSPPETETPENRAHHLNELLRGSFTTYGPTQFRVNTRALAAYQDYYHRVNLDAGSHSQRAIDLDRSDISVHYYLVADPHIRDEDRILLRSLVLGEKRLDEVLAVVAQRERNQTTLLEPTAATEMSARRRAIHWALYRYAGPIEYEAAVRSVYADAILLSQNLPEELKRYVSHLDYQTLRSLYLGIENRFDSLFDDSPTPGYRRYTNLVGIIESQNISLGTNEWKNLFIGVKEFAAACLRSRGDVLTPLVFFEISPSQDYWTGFTAGVAPLMRRANLALETPDSFDDARMFRPVFNALGAFKREYRRYTASERTTGSVNTTDQWFHSTLFFMGARAPGLYRHYLPRLVEEAIPPSDETPLWTEAQLRQAVQSDSAARLSVSQLPLAWQTTLKSVTLEVPFPDRPTFIGTAYDFINRYARSIYFTSHSRRGSELGTITRSEKSVSVILSGNRLNVPAILETLVHESYHLAFDEEVVRRYPWLAQDILLNERNAFVLMRNFIEKAFPLLIEEDMTGTLSRQAPQTERTVAQRSMIMRIKFSNACMLYAVALGWGDQHDGEAFYTDPVARTAWSYFTTTTRIQDANQRFGYAPDDYSMRYEIQPQTSRATRTRYPSDETNDVDAIRGFDASIIHLFEIAGFHVSEASR